MFFKEHWLLVPHSSSFRAQVTPSICFGLTPIRDLYKRAILNSLPTFIKCFNAFFNLAVGAILLSLFNCNNQNSFCPVGPRGYVSRMCVEMGGKRNPWLLLFKIMRDLRVTYCLCTAQGGAAGQIHSSGCCFLKNTVT